MTFVPVVLSSIVDVEVFGPLKTTMGAQLSRLYTMEISHLQKVEWVEKYVPAREKAIMESNINGG